MMAALLALVWNKLAVCLGKKTWVWGRNGWFPSALCVYRQCGWNWFQGLGSANQIRNMSTSPRGHIGTGSVIFDIYLVLIWKQAPECSHLAPQQYCVLPSNTSRRYWIHFFPSLCQNQPKKSLWWGTDILFLERPFYHHVALMGAVATLTVECSVLQPMPSAESIFRLHNFVCNVVASKLFNLDCCQSSWIFLPWLKLTTANKKTGKYISV